MAWTLGRAGLQPDAYRATAMRRRIPACLRHLRVSSPAAARQLMERKPELLPLVLNTVLVGVSEFFRDRPVFEDLAEMVLPELLRQRTGVRVCSAGASGGQELYSVAMLLAEAGALDGSDLLGVDCRPDAVRSARRGIFNDREMEGVEPSRRDRFFHHAHDRWEVLPALKRRIRWELQDLLGLDAGGPCDLILFRNVAIYFSETHGANAWARLCDQLSPGGFLVTGKAEKPPATLPLTRLASCIYRKHQP